MQLIEVILHENLSKLVFIEFDNTFETDFVWFTFQMNVDIIRLLLLLQFYSWYNNLRYSKENCSTLIIKTSVYKLSASTSPAAFTSTYYYSQQKIVEKTINLNKVNEYYI